MVKINYYKVILNTDKDIYVHPIGDTHIGHVNSNVEFLLDKLASIREGYNNRIILMGDLMDTGIKTSIGASSYEQNLPPQDQVDYLVKILEPYSSRIDGYVMGNHEYRIFKETGIDVCKIICDRLNIPYCKYSGVITYSLSHKAYDINFFHGNCGGGVENALRNVKSMSMKTVADIYLMGHVHQLAYTSRIINKVDSRNSKVTEAMQYFVLTGHSLDYNESYADKANLEISPKGFPIIKLFNGQEKKVEVFTPNEEV